MIYSEIIGLNEYFQPAFDIENEVGDYWKQFIYHKQFYEVLSATINSLTSSRADERKSIWMQGTYGTGKSHATSVIKHLLSDNIEEISDFIENIDNEQIKLKIKDFRRNKRVFPVVIKGVGMIHDNRSFSYEIQKEVEFALEKAGISLKTKSSFEMMINRVKDRGIQWEVYLQEADPKISELSRDEIIEKLRSGDIEVLEKLEDILSQNGLQVAVPNIEKWLVEVKNELKEREVADYVMIFWDEFTGILEIPNRNLIFNQLQNISELSTNDQIYLFVICHRKPDVFQEELEKIFGRHKVMDYKMESVTTYHIINGAIKKKDKEKWEDLKNKNINILKEIINYIAENEDYAVKKQIENIFPIHPYTAYLSTLLARNIGSTERSIFNFLYDYEKGFLKFINTNPGETNNYLLSVDYLWDFFYEEFERSNNDRILGILDRYKLGLNRIQDNNTLKIFKGILILNILFSYIQVDERSLFAPSIINIKYLFKGIIDNTEIDNILTNISKQEIISETGNLYLVTGGSLPFGEIEQEKKKLIKDISDINDILNLQSQNIIKNNIDNGGFRDAEIIILDAGIKEHILRNKLEKAFKEPHTLKVVFFIAKDNLNENFEIEEKGEKFLQNIINIINKLKNSEDYKNYIFVISKKIINANEIKKFIDFQAKAIVAERHNYSDERNINDEYADKVIKKITEDISKDYIEYFLNDEREQIPFKEFPDKLKKDLSGEVFKYGFERIKKLLENRNVWKPNQKLVEPILFATNRTDLENLTSGFSAQFKLALSFFKNNQLEYIINEDFKFKENVEEHPLYFLTRKIETIIEANKNKSNFNLGDELQVIKETPLGVYNVMFYQGAVAFALRKYINKFFEIGTGRPITKEKMRDIVKYLFEFFTKERSRDKLNIRYGTEGETKLIKILEKIFDLDEIEGLNNLRWKIRMDWCESKKIPIWLMIYSDEVKNNKNIHEAINNINELVQSLDQDIDYNKILVFYENIEKFEIALQRIFRNEALDREQLLKNFIECKQKEDEVLKKINISDYSIIKNILNFLDSELQEVVDTWQENKVIEKIKDWIIIYLGTEIQPPPPPPPPPEPGGDGGEEGESPGPLPNRLIRKIEECDEEKLKTVLKELIKNSSIAKRVQSLLG